MKYPIILGHRSKDTLKAEAYHKNASYFLLGELRIFILNNTRARNFNGKSICHIKSSAHELLYHWRLRCHIAGDELSLEKGSTTAPGFQYYWYWISVLVILDFNTTDIGFQYYWYWISILLILDFNTTDIGFQYYWYWISILLILDFSTTAFQYQ